jgi:hypothetical protein
MNNLESKFKTALVVGCIERGAYARRHEDRYAIGLLDMAIKFPEHPYILAEGKLVQHQSFAPTPAQYEEGKKFIRAGGICALIGWDPATKQMYIHEWAKTAKKATAFTAHNGGDAQMLEAWLEWRKNISSGNRP